MKLDILVFAAHPDDAELSCSGTIALHVALGKKVGIIDLTEGELGTRGSVAQRYEEAAAAAKVLQLSARENLQLADGFFTNDEASQRKLIEVIRRYQPDIVFANALIDRHIDHGKGAKLAHDACFLAGLRKVETLDKHTGQAQASWRPRAVWHYIQDQWRNPDVVVDISAHWATKEAAIRAFKSQFYDPQSDEPTTPISTPDFMQFLESRARDFGRLVGVTYGEGFEKATPVGVSQLTDLW
ncbi:bacillithiol biosynthesis deacetylase BshB1 [Eisenibacter elegans]|uniref:bacillithiol biosynthesis deacetylase BshB1 n=1 Tax=Eisenibacter elegans TaxID=997 RepID=UPI0004228C96|nr:bacillithiol biosynthesis deacetylase BshB1 [Eisenibacter elegans]